MRKYINLFLYAMMAIVGFSCVDDYQEANPAPLLDGPATYLDYTGNEVVLTNTAGDEFTYVENGGTATFEISVVDAPGLIDSVSFSLTNIQRPDNWGTVTIEGLDAVRGSSTGTFNVVYNAPVLDESVNFTFADENIIINVYDDQDPRKVSEIISIPTIRTTRSECFSAGDFTGTNDVVSSGFDAENGEDYSNLEAAVAFNVRPTEHPGIYFMGDVTFGLYPYQGYSAPAALVEVCDNNVTQILTGAAAEFNSWSGVYDPATSTITFNWETIYGDTGTSVMTID